MATSSQLLTFESLNPSQPTTVLLLHGGFSSHREWVLTTPHLESYHLLIPDLPSHGRDESARIQTFSFPDTAALLADLITKHAHNRRAHVVGLSLGGYSALYLAAKYPNLIDNVFATGCGQRWDGKPWRAWLTGYLLSINVLVMMWMPDSSFECLCRYFGLAVPEGLREDMSAASGFKLGTELAKSLLEDFTADVWEGVKARTLLVAGALDDDVGQTKAQGMLLRKGNEGSMSCKVEGKRHAWDLQDGELFAKGVKAWIDEKELPKEFEML